MVPLIDHSDTQAAHDEPQLPRASIHASVYLRIPPSEHPDGGIPHNSGFFGMADHHPARLLGAATQQ